jgi:AraC-like DNA-binding protein
MIAERHIPLAPLSQFVQLLWYYDGFVQPHSKERLLPDGSLSLVVNLHQDRIRVFNSRDTSQCDTLRGGHVLSGARASFFVLDTENAVGTVGVHFRPGGASPFLRMPVSEVSELSLSLDQLWGSEGSDLRGHLLEAASVQRKFQIVEQWLLERLAKPLERTPAVAYAVRQFQQPVAPSVSCVVDRIGMSHRRFIQIFTAEVGLSPKVFSRIMRFQRAVNCIRERNEADWARLALDCGYYDQAHFIHDFQVFSGITPSTYIASGPRLGNHVPLHE